jgi:hypothetical protein
MQFFRHQELQAYKIIAIVADFKHIVAGLSGKVFTATTKLLTSTCASQGWSIAV